jgi:DNA polymerase-3 subunit beta
MEKRFIVEQKNLVNLLASMQPICTKRTTLDITGTIFFSVGHKEMVIKGTDLELSLQASCSLVESTLTDTESFLVPGKRLFEVVKELEGNIEFLIKKHQLIIQAGSINLALNIKDVEEFPPFPERIENLMNLDAPFLLKMLDNVAFLVPQSNVNPALNGLFIEINDQQLTLTATDGHCLVQARSTKHTLATPKSWLLPRRAIVELKKILESFQDQTIFMGTCGNQLVFSGDLFNFFTKLLADSFPNYKSIMERTSFVASTVDRSKLTKTLRRSACLLSGQFLATRFSFEPEKLRVSMNNKEVGTLDEELPITGYAGENLDIRFYAPYVLNGLQAFNDATVTFYLQNSMRPIIFETKATDLEMTYLVMPVAPVASEQ